MSKSLYVQFGCGLSAPSGFINYDSSITLRCQRNFILSGIAKKILNPRFQDSIVYGDIVRGLPISKGSLLGIYSSHVLEHLTYFECKLALANAYSYLQEGGVFRAVLPDLQKLLSIYFSNKERGDEQAANKLMRWTFLGYEERPRGLFGTLKWSLSNSNHFWMWDYESLSYELKKTGFKKIYRSQLGQSVDSTFNMAEDPSRFEDALCIEAIK